MASRLPKLVVIATVGGAFSGLFGVGGGTVIVPLLILWFGYGEREATGTSLLAIIVIAALAATAQGTWPGSSREPRSSSGSRSARSPRSSRCCS
jgi:uncharacterized membrane protein YfcA